MKITVGNNSTDYEVECDFNAAELQTVKQTLAMVNTLSENKWFMRSESGHSCEPELKTTDYEKEPNSEIN